jgi:prevent-host-death family protein
VDKTINTKDLRTSMAEVVRRVRKGERFLVLHRSRPAFRLVPVEASDREELPLEDDPMYRAPALGASRDGSTSKDHDLVLYGKARR